MVLVATILNNGVEDYAAKVRVGHPFRIKNNLLLAICKKAFTPQNSQFTTSP